MVSESLIVRLISQSIRIFESALQSHKTKLSSDPKANFEKNLRSHLSEIANWAGQISFHPMVNTLDAGHTTIPLTLTNVPRRYRKPNQKISTFGEDEILNRNVSTLIVGDPGSGKTTTVKRICHNLLFEESGENDLDWQYPICIILRRQNTAKNIYRIIADELGIRYEARKHENDVAASDSGNTVEVSKIEKIAREEGIFKTKKKMSQAEKIARDEEVYNRQSRAIHDEITYFVGSERLENFIVDLLDETKCLLLVDGLDEINKAEQEQIISDLKSVDQKLSSSKIVATVRSGIGLHIEGFDLFEICALDDSDIEKISHNWSRDPDALLKEIDRMGYKELCSRPLFLCYLIAIFENQRELPRKPSQVYRRVLRMFLEEWNLDPEVDRPTRYALFDSDTKIEFLSSVAFELLFNWKKAIFDEQDLTDIYNEIHDRFDLPQDEAINVAQELETHTGIIAQVDMESYEFTHLSMMEYLASQHLALGTDVADLSRYIQVNPAAVAGAVGVSSNASDYLARILLVKQGFGAVSLDQWSIFLSRIKLENPNFEPSKLLGEGLLRLLSRGNCKLSEALADLLDNKNVCESLALALSNFSYLRSAKSNLIQLKREIHIDGYGRALKFARELTLSSEPLTSFCAKMEPTVELLWLDRYEKIVR